MSKDFQKLLPIALMLLIGLTIPVLTQFQPQKAQKDPIVTVKEAVQPKTKKLALDFDKRILGKASWYGVPFHGRRTANGEIYNMHTLTAAHKTLPFDSIVKVTNQLNNESIIVRINDRGPYINGRDIDLSYGAAKQLNMLHSGVIPVKLEVITNKSKFVYRTPPSLNKL